MMQAGWRSKVAAMGLAFASSAAMAQPAVDDPRIVSAEWLRKPAEGRFQPRPEAEGTGCVSYLMEYRFAP